MASQDEQKQYSPIFISAVSTNIVCIQRGIQHTLVGGGGGGAEKWGVVGGYSTKIFTGRLSPRSKPWGDLHRLQRLVCLVETTKEQTTEQCSQP